MASRRLRGVRFGCAVAVTLALGTGCESAETSGIDRPPIGATPLAGACSPLPRGVHLSFPHQARSELDYVAADGARRIIVVQVDRISAGEAARTLDRQLRARGFSAVPTAQVPGRQRGQGWQFYEHDSSRLTGFRAERLPGTSASDLVRATIQLDVPRRAAPARCPALPRTSPAPSAGSR